MPRRLALCAFVACVSLLPAASASAAPSSSSSVDACTGDAVVFLLDRSGSMVGAPLEQAKAGAKSVASKLGSNDCYGLVAFDSQPTRTVSLAPVTDQAAIAKTIDGVTAGGGTEFSGALNIALADLSVAKKAKRKTVIFLTDGQAPKNGVEDLAKAMAAQKIRVSTIGLGGSTDEAMLRTIAEKTGGHMRLVGAPADLPRNLEEELAALRR